MSSKNSVLRRKIIAYSALFAAFSKPSLLLTVKGGRLIAKEYGGIFSVMVAPAAIKAPSDTVTGATKLLLLPIKRDRR